MSKFGTTVSTPQSGFGTRGDNDFYDFHCIQRFTGDGTMEIIPKKTGTVVPVPNPTKVHIKATIQYTCKCEQGPPIPPGAGAYGPSTGPACTGGITSFNFQRNKQSLDTCPPREIETKKSSEATVCTRSELIDIDETVSLASFIGGRVNQYEQGLTCLWFLANSDDEMLMAAPLINCGAKVEEFMGVRGKALRVCFEPEEMADCLENKIFDCSSKNEKAVMQFIGAYIDKWFSGSGYGCADIV